MLESHAFSTNFLLHPAELSIPSLSHACFQNCLIFQKDEPKNTRSGHLAKDSEKFGGNGTEKTLKSEQLVQCVVITGSYTQP